ncbi:MAG: hypothetical protein P4L84_11560 [Isosphaeraceae bacterium]|nr:hypothetical protein [Isosphaeraceae bacterium]
MRLCDRSLVTPRRLAILGAILGVSSLACRQEPKGFERYVPAPEAARAAVTLTMDGWRKGLTPDETVGQHPEVHVVDKHRRPEQHLANYEILGEVAAENARGFAVRVTFDGSDEPQVVRYLIVGTDPMWVFRQEDYEMISHWMHKMDEPSDRAGEPTAKP